MIIDCHAHCSHDGSYGLSADEMVESLDRYGVDKAVCSRPMSTPPAEATPDEVRQRNDTILKSVKMHPDRIMGYCFLNPGFGQFAQDEITRCVVDGGLVGVKLYNQYPMSDPVQYPIIERCIELGVPILMHAGYPSEAYPPLRKKQPNITTGAHYADVGPRYPEAMFICGHIGGGGDWERQLKGLREAPNVFVDTSGSVCDAGLIEKSLRELGPNRLLFACDGSMERGLAKVGEARMKAGVRRNVMGKNFMGILARRKA